LNVLHTDKKCKKKSGAAELRFLLFVLILVDGIEEFLKKNNNNVNDASVQFSLFKTARTQKC